MKHKLAGILALTAELGPNFKGNIVQYIEQFKKNQNMFQGVRNTYTEVPGTDDIPSLRNFTPVVTTVDEKLEWFVEHATKFVDAMLSKEATNASGKAVTNLIVDGEDWGIVSTNELMLLDNLLSNYKLQEMYETIPVRSDAQQWLECEDESFRQRKLVQSELLAFEKKTSETQQYVLSEANQYNPTPVIGNRTITIKLGMQTTQKFSGEWSQHNRAHTLARLKSLKVACKEALARANELEAIASSITTKRIFDYLHGK